MDKGILQTRGYHSGLPAALTVGLALLMFRFSKMPKSLLFLGGASYSMYLIHIYFIESTSKVFNLFGKGLPPAIILIPVLTLLIILASLITYKYFDYPLNKYLRKKLNKSFGYKQ